MVKILIKLLVSVTVTYFIAINYEPKNHSEILAIASPLSTVAGILFGFIIAYVTAFSSNSQNELIMNMRDTNMYIPLMTELSHTGFGLITSCIFMVLAIFTPHNLINDSMTYTWDYALLIIGFGILIYSLVCFWNCWTKVHKVIKHL